MARTYKSQLEVMRQKALADGYTHAIFWERWSVTMTSVLRDNPTMSSDSQIYKAEKTFFEKNWNEPFWGQDPSLAYVKQTRSMWLKARKDKIPIQKWDACWKEVRSISFGNVSREAEQYLVERWVWRKLWSRSSPFPGADPREPTTTLGKAKACTPANKDKASSASTATKKQEPKKQEPARGQKPETDLHRPGPRPVATPALAKAPETVFAPSLDIRTAKSSGSQVVKINDNNPPSQPVSLEPYRVAGLPPRGPRSTTRSPAFPSQTTKEINSSSKVNEKALVAATSQTTRLAINSPSEVTEKVLTDAPPSQPVTPKEPNRAAGLPPNTLTGRHSTTRRPVSPSQTMKSEINSPSKMNERALTTVPSHLLSKKKAADSQVKTEDTQGISMRDEFAEIIDCFLADDWPPPTRKRALPPSMDEGGPGVLGNKKRVKREEAE